MVATGAGSNDATPAPKPLAKAVADSLGSDVAFEGVSARVKFTNRLLDSSGITSGTDPVMGGGSGRFWADPDGRFRIELQSDGGGGDAQIVSDGKQVWVNYAMAGAWKATLPSEESSKKYKDNDSEWPPSVKAVARAIEAISGDATVSGATPDNIGGRPAYTVEISPKDTSGLFAGGKVSWDAENGAPLAVSILAKGDSTPVLDMRATEVTFGPVDASVFDAAPPAGAKVVDLEAAKAELKKEKASSKGKSDKPVTGREAVQAKLGFDLVAPATLAGRKLERVMLVGEGKKAGAALAYGSGMDALLVVQMPDSGKKVGTGGDWGEEGISLPTEKIGSVEALKLGTPLGSAVSFVRNGVRFTVAGSVKADTTALAASQL
jgi:outer membrane lipoprotein-sorting protein